MALNLTTRKQNENILSKSNLPIRVERRQGQTMPLELTDLNSSSVVAVNSDNRNAMRRNAMYNSLNNDNRNDCVLVKMTLMLMIKDSNK